MSGRRNPTNSIGANDSTTIEHNAWAGAKKTIPMVGYLEYQGTGALQFEVGALLSLFNSTTSVQYAAFAVLGASAPATPGAAGMQIIELPPMAYTPIAMGPYAQITTSSGVSVYRLMDDTTFTLYKQS